MDTVEKATNLQQMTYSLSNNNRLLLLLRTMISLDNNLMTCLEDLENNKRLQQIKISLEEELHQVSQYKQPQQLISLLKITAKAETCLEDLISNNNSLLQQQVVAEINYLISFREFNLNIT